LNFDVKELQKYDIDIFKLSDKQHVYTFESDDTFFALFEQGLVKKGEFKTRLLLDKSPTMLVLQFQTDGWVELICDRTLEPFQHPIQISQQLIMKYGEENKELTDEIEIITRDTQRINVAHYIFEFIGLSLPMKKLHPSLHNKPAEVETEEGILVYRSEESAGADETENAPDEDTKIDPRWQALRKLKE
jgi:uncharacterized metal-binding protein YceD (DUF177 family)